MGTKFTPGPWAHVVKMDGFTAVGASTLIARVFSRDFGDAENEAANAHLISAAPDMYEALKALDAAYCEVSDNMTREQRDRGRKALIAARAALQKATPQEIRK